MTIANSVSRTSVGLFSPCSITAEMLSTSITVTDKRQHQRAVGLAEDFGDMVGVPDDREGGAHHNAE